MPVADAGYLLVRISKVTPGNVSEQQAAQAADVDERLVDRHEAERAGADLPRLEPQAFPKLRFDNATGG